MKHFCRSLFIFSLVFVFICCNGNKKKNDSDSEPQAEAVSDNPYDYDRGDSVRYFWKMINIPRRDYIKYIYADFDNNGRPDFVAVHRSHTVNAKGDTIGSNVFLTTIMSSTKDMTFNKMPMQFLFPGRTDTCANSFQYGIDSVRYIKDGFEVFASHDFGKYYKKNMAKKGKDSYRRTMTFVYDAEKEDFKLTKDGGVGVFSEKSSYITPSDKLGVDVYAKDWEEWYYDLTSDYRNSPISGKKLVFVDDEEGFLRAIGSNRAIIVDAERLNLSSNTIERLVAEYGIDTSYFKYGGGLEIHNVSNMSIIGKHACDVWVDNYYDNVISFHDCKDISLRYMKMRHDVSDKGSCLGDVAFFFRCSNVSIYNCEFNGCGAVGLYLQLCNGIVVHDSKFHNNSNCGIFCYVSKNVDFYDSRLYNNRHGVISLSGSYSNFYRCDIYQNTAIEYVKADKEREGKGVFKDCRIYNNVPAEGFKGYTILVDEHYKREVYDADINSGYAEIVTVGKPKFGNAVSSPNPVAEGSDTLQSVH